MAKIFDNIYDPNKHKYVENYTFNNVQRLADKAWTFNITAYELAKLWDEEKLVYYPDTQRGVIQDPKEYKKGNIKYKAVYNKKRVQEIESKIIQEDYFGDQLTINIILDDSVVEYDEYTLTLHVAKGLICMLDGQHRTKACHKIYQNMMTLEDEKLKSILMNLKFPVRITNYDVDTAALQFYQLQMGEKISKSRAESFNRQEAVNRIIHQLNKNSVLKDKIDDIRTSISKNDKTHIVTFNTMATAFKDTFGNVSDEKQEKEYLEFLKEFFLELTNIYPEMLDPEKREASKVYMFTCENFMFYGYLELAKYLFIRKNKNWKEMLRKVKSIDMHKSAKHWSEVVRVTDNGISIINNTSSRRSLRKAYENEFVAAIEM